MKRKTKYLFYVYIYIILNIFVSIFQSVGCTTVRLYGASRYNVKLNFSLSNESRAGKRKPGVWALCSNHTHVIHSFTQHLPTFHRRMQYFMFRVSSSLQSIISLWFRELSFYFSTVHSGVSKMRTGPDYLSILAWRIIISSRCTVD